MPDSVMFRSGNRRLQDQLTDSRRIADRLEEKLETPGLHRQRPSAFIEKSMFFFLATGSDAEGRSRTCSFKGGTPGFVEGDRAGQARLSRL